VRPAGLRENKKKIRLFRKKVRILGIILDGEGKQLEEVKKRFANLEPPNTVSELRRALEHAGQFRDCARDYGVIVEPLTAGTGESSCPEKTKEAE
jgi:hypothetical protein